mgnify:CR=1 FL=1
MQRIGLSGNGIGLSSDGRGINRGGSLIIRNRLGIRLWVSLGGLQPARIEGGLGTEANQIECAFASGPLGCWLGGRLTRCRCLDHRLQAIVRDRAREQGGRR